VAVDATLLPERLGRMADPIAEWNEYWKKIDADIRFTLGVELVEVDDRQVVMRMPFKPDISEATGCSQRER
jgi:hypothetical protein